MVLNSFNATSWWLLETKKQGWKWKCRTGNDLYYLQMKRKIQKEWIQLPQSYAPTERLLPSAHNRIHNIKDDPLSLLNIPYIPQFPNHSFGNSVTPAATSPLLFSPQFLLTYTLLTLGLPSKSKPILLVLSMIFIRYYIFDNIWTGI